VVGRIRFSADQLKNSLAWAHPTSTDMMTSILIGVLDRNRITAEPGFNRWLVPPAALAIHLCIGMAYGFSVFWLPLSRAIGIPCGPETGLLRALVETTCDWRISDLGWIYTLFFVALGSAAAVCGGWVERAGPRRAGLLSAICWCGGLLVSALGIVMHQLWLMWLGSGVIGGIGLGLGYISPVSTLIRWFPDRRGMATGMAIMGFGGGAMIGAPLADVLMNTFRTSNDVGVWQTFVALAGLYFVFMTGGALGYRLPPTGWRPAGWEATRVSAGVATGAYVHPRDAVLTPQFWCVWAILCLNVSAGIGVIGMASPMLQEIFSGSLLGRPDLSFTVLNEDQRRIVAAIAAGFTGLLSLFNIGGRFFWASLSDVIGRRATYATFFGLGIALYAGAPWAAHTGSKALFVACFCVILSMYGGGFATIPAYLADLFGTRFVGAIHGRLLTAWSTAGIIGPVVVNYLREAQIAAGVARASVYDFTMYILAAMLAAGFVFNLLVRPVNPRWFRGDDITLPPPTAPMNAPAGSTIETTAPVTLTLILAWLAVALPMAWGVWITLSSALVLFR
jgi:MFS family permease